MREDFIEEYIQESASEVPNYLLDLERETYMKALKPKMISGRVQGRFLSFISKLKQPSQILEVGTFTGYSALCLAEGLEPEGNLLTLEVNDELESFHQKYLSSGEYANQIAVRYGDAVQIIPELPEKSFDIVFLDANKKMYPDYLHQASRILRSGGILLADNVLWWDKVMDPSVKDPETNALRTFNENIKHSQEFESFILPLRDGITVAQKK